MGFGGGDKEVGRELEEVCLRVGYMEGFDGCILHIPKGLYL